MELIYYIDVVERAVILQQQGFDYDNPDSTRSRRARLVLDAQQAVEYYRQLEFNMNLIFQGKMHMRHYRKKYDTIMSMAGIRRDVARWILDKAGVERLDCMRHVLRAIRKGAKK